MQFWYIFAKHMQLLCTIFATLHQQFTNAASLTVQCYGNYINAVSCIIHYLYKYTKAIPTLDDELYTLAKHIKQLYQICINTSTRLYTCAEHMQTLYTQLFDVTALYELVNLRIGSG